MKQKNRDTFYIGLALFASYFGAGNLIFPGALGLVSGDQWSLGAVGLMISAVLMPIVALYVISRAGSVEALTKNIHPEFSKYLLLLIMLFAGHISVPRTGAVAYELGVHALFPKVPMAVFALFYFGIALYFALDLSAMIDKVARYLTPALVAILFIIVIKGVLFPIDAVPADPQVDSVLLNSFLGGYQTGDLLVSFLIGTVFIGDIVRRGYARDKDRNTIVAKAGVITFGLFFVIYVGLLFFGAKLSGQYPADIDHATLLLNIVRAILGEKGLALLSIAVVLACLTTAIGQITSIANFFHEFTKGKLSHKQAAILFSCIGAGITLLGVEKIIFLATPIYLMVYPSVIMLMILGVFYKPLKDHALAFRVAMVFTLVISLLEAITAFTGLPLLEAAVDAIPLSGAGFAWLLPAVTGFVLGLIYELAKGTTNAAVPSSVENEL